MARHQTANRFFKNHGILTAAAIAAAISLQTAAAATWIGPASGEAWSTGSNWDTGTAPGAGVEAYFGQTTTVNAASEHEANIYVATGATLTLTGINYHIGRGGSNGTLNMIGGGGELVMEGTNTLREVFVRGGTTIDVGTFTHKLDGNTLQFNGILGPNVQKVIQDGNSILQIQFAQPNFQGDIWVNNGTVRINVGATMGTATVYFNGDDAISPAMLEFTGDASAQSMHTVPNNIVVQGPAMQTIDTRWRTRDFQGDFQFQNGSELRFFSGAVGAILSGELSGSGSITAYNNVANNSNSPITIKGSIAADADLFITCQNTTLDGATLNYDFNSSSSTGLITVDGTLAMMNSITLNISDTTKIADGTPYPLINYPTAIAGWTDTLYTTDGGLSLGTITLGDGWSSLSSEVEFQIYQDDGGVFMKFTGISTIPEPASLASLGLGAIGLLARRRR
ncbi:MAG: PEP-CTERM sorting domain-containing protein [Phycisphaerales bacterium]|nr:PEP-CTERM sorting domain-containing protein [Phycisphaerales bacterium]